MDEFEKLASQYVEAAVKMLEENGQPYGDDDIEKVASFLIDADYAQDQQPVDEEAVRVAAFYDELQKQAEALESQPQFVFNPFEKDAAKCKTPDKKMEKGKKGFKPDFGKKKK